MYQNVLIIVNYEASYLITATLAFFRNIIRISYLHQSLQIIYKNYKNREIYASINDVICNIKKIV